MNRSEVYYKTISEYRRARYEYAIEESYEAGIALEGWEVKSIRDGRVSFDESYCSIHRGRLLWVGGHISPLPNVGGFVRPDPTRSRALLLHKREIRRLLGAVEREGYTLIPLSLYWKDHRIKLKIALAKGRKQHDKRQVIKEREWRRQKSALRGAS